MEDTMVVLVQEGELKYLQTTIANAADYLETGHADINTVVESLRESLKLVESTREFLQQEEATTEEGIC